MRSDRLVTHKPSRKINKKVSILKPELLATLTEPVS